MTFAPAVFSEGTACPSELGDHAIAMAPGFAQNPFPSDAAGQPAADGDHLTYQMLVIQADGSDPADAELTVRPAMAVVSNDGDDSDVVDMQWLGDATALTTIEGDTLHGTAPTVTADGGLLVFEAEGDTLEYSRIADPGAELGAGWTTGRSVSALFAEGDVVGPDGLTLAERYPLAAAQLRGPDGRPLSADAPYVGAYPWISQDGTELFHTATIAGNPDRDGERGRRGAVSVIGQGTGHALRHIDGPINPSREGMTDAVTIRERVVSPGRSHGMWSPYPEARGTLPVHGRGKAYPLMASVTDGATPFSTYAEVDFDAFGDGDYLVYLPMNESLATDGDVTYDITHTPDLSGNFNTGELGEGARFSVEEFGLDDGGRPSQDDNSGAHGRAIYFTDAGVVRVSALDTPESRAVDSAPSSSGRATRSPTAVRGLSYSGRASPASSCRTTARSSVR